MKQRRIRPIRRINENVDNQQQSVLFNRFKKLIDDKLFDLCKRTAEEEEIKIIEFWFELDDYTLVAEIDKHFEYWGDSTDALNLNLINISIINENGDVTSLMQPVANELYNYIQSKMVMYVEDINRDIADAKDEDSYRGSGRYYY